MVGRGGDNGGGVGGNNVKDSHDQFGNFILGQNYNKKINFGVILR